VDRWVVSLFRSRCPIFPAPVFQFLFSIFYFLFSILQFLFSNTMDTMSEKPQLFGTDGVRGIAGEYPLDRPTVWRIGCAVGSVMTRSVSNGPLRAVLGEDTRESSAWISRTLAAGLLSKGVDVAYAGVITTPGVAFLARHRRFAAGIVVSASHNPYEDNGIKVLSSSGTKLAEAQELEIERAIEAELETPGLVPPEVGLQVIPELLDDYVEFLTGLVPRSVPLAKYRLVVDCAHGAALRVAPRVFKELGIEPLILHTEASGRDINLGCGSLHPDVMARETLSSSADLGVAFDGDADRAIFATDEGNIADGDHVLFATAPYFKVRGRLKMNAVVGTLMTNLGLELALAEQGIGLKRTAVGDKYVLEEMLRSGINLGGEPSGHIIFSDISPAGDGILTTLQLLILLAETAEPLSELVRGLRPFPQIIRNVAVAERPPLDSIREVAQAVADFQRRFGERGRVVVRYSGTQSLARVMVEAEDAGAVEHYASRIATAIDTAAGVKNPLA
jgi:phosphoglucosamine mutase